MSTDLVRVPGQPSLSRAAAGLLSSRPALAGVPGERARVRALSAAAAKGRNQDCLPAARQSLGIARGRRTSARPTCARTAGQKPRRLRSLFTRPEFSHHGDQTLTDRSID